MANVYQVFANLDGVLSIHGSKKRAIDAAIKWIQDSGSEEFTIDTNNPCTTYIEGKAPTVYPLAVQVEQFYLE